MSMNQLSSDKPWWMEMESPSQSSEVIVSQNALVEEDEDEEDENKNLPLKKNEERESMFEKLLTPSDVGKLNRLVIPKQHAERYFPIGGGGDSGVVLSFEDELGKLWKFRYSYWNSSQSYVLTKGWSRYVKEKRLCAGDTILFQRFRDGGERFWIGWRPPPPVTQPPGAGGWTPHGVQHPYPSPVPYQPHCPHAPERAKWSCGAQKQTSAAGNSSSSSVNCKTVRLFGVDLECQLDDDHGPNHPAAHQPHQYNNNPSTSNHG